MLKNIFYPTMFIATALLLLALLMVPHALASPSTVTFTVDSVLDQIDDDTSDGICHSAANHCTLRAAIMQANILPGLGVTIIVPSGTYTLTRPPAGLDGDDNGDLNLTTPGSGSPVITITGAGAGSTIIDANQLDRVFHVHPNRGAAITDVTIRNGYFAGLFSAYGGGIYNQGSLTVSGAMISANHTRVGGGLYNSGDLTVMNSTLSQNTADNSGGGLYNSGNLTVTNSTLSQNAAITAGGGIDNNGNLKVSNSTIFGNGSYDGGGIYTGAANLFVINSTISQNYANDNGGGVYVYAFGGLTALYNTSVINNDADHDQDPTGGIGGGIYSEAGSRFIVVNTLIAANTILNAPIYNDCNGTLEVYGWNLFGEVTGCAFSGNGTDSRGLISLNTIGPLQNNGGPTWTHALLPGSAAIDTTLDVLGCVNETGALLTTDQRGMPRPVGARCDVGAFEYRPLLYLYLPLILR